MLLLEQAYSKQHLLPACLDHEYGTILRGKKCGKTSADNCGNIWSHASLAVMYLCIIWGKSIDMHRFWLHKCGRLQIPPPCFISLHVMSFSVWPWSPSLRGNQCFLSSTSIFGVPWCALTNRNDWRSCLVMTCLGHFLFCNFIIVVYEDEGRLMENEGQLRGLFMYRSRASWYTWCEL